MNKIKAKINALQQFSPWDDSFRDLYKTLQMSKRMQAQYKFSTISQKPSSLYISQRNPSKQQLNRTILNMSKINLHAGQQSPPRVVANQSKRYLGPRVTFYAKMNPRSIRSKSALQIDQQLFKQTHLLTKQYTGRILRDQSIKFLDVIEEDIPKLLKSNDSRYMLPKNYNFDQIQRAKSQKKEEKHSYLRRLKNIYNSRKH